MYGKIFESIYDGSLADNYKALIVFTQMIILANEDGVVDMTIGAMSRKTGIPRSYFDEGIPFLEKEDSESRSPKENGRRIIRLDNHRSWGWYLVNYKYYRDLASREDKKRADRERIAVKRAQEREQNQGCSEVSQGVVSSSELSESVADVAHTDTDTDTDIDIVSSSNEEDTASISKNSNCPYQKIIDIYHNKLPELPKVQDLSDKLKSRIKARWKSDKQRQNLKWWEWYFEGVSECDYLVGKVKDWAANFYWLTGPENMTKVLNGQYVNRGTPSKTDQAVEDFLNED